VRRRARAMGRSLGMAVSLGWGYLKQDIQAFR
jgi:hypothetical protein